MNWDETNQDILAMKVAIVSVCAEDDHHVGWCGFNYVVSECCGCFAEVKCLKKYMKEKGVV